MKYWMGLFTVLKSLSGFVYTFITLQTVTHSLTVGGASTLIPTYMVHIVKTQSQEVLFCGNSCPMLMGQWNTGKRSSGAFSSLFLFLPPPSKHSLGTLISGCMLSGLMTTKYLWIWVYGKKLSPLIP